MVVLHRFSNVIQITKLIAAKQLAALELSLHQSKNLLIRNEIFNASKTKFDSQKY